jgi:nucleoid-associated protein YgaU
LGKSPLPGGAGIVPRDPEGTVYGTRRADEARRTHMIVDGDTLFYLAERYLGDGERYLEIFEANRDVLSDPDLLVLGAVLRLPSADTPAPSPEESLAEAASSGSLVPVSTSSPVAPMTEVAPPAAPPAVNLATPPPVGTATTVSVDSASFARPQTYRVRAGDTLVDISRRVYGDARRYLEIYEANRDRLRRPQDLREGVILVIP